MTDPQQRRPHLRLLPLCGINPASYDFRLGIIPPPSCQRHRNKCNDPSSVSNTQKQCFARMRLFPTRAQKQLADRRGWNDGVTAGGTAARWKKKSTPSDSHTNHWVESDCDHQSGFFSELYKSLDCDHTGCWVCEGTRGNCWVTATFQRKEKWLCLGDGACWTEILQVVHMDVVWDFCRLWCVSQTPLCASRSSDWARFLHLPDWRWQTMTAPAGCGRLLWEQAVFPPPPPPAGPAALRHHGQRRWLGSAGKLWWPSSSSPSSSSGPWWGWGRWNPATASRTWPPAWTSSGREPTGGGWTWKTWRRRRASSTWAAATLRLFSPNQTEITAYSTTCTSSTTCGTALPAWTTSTFTGIMCWCHTGTPKSQPAMPKESTHLRRILPQVFTPSWDPTVPGTQRCWSRTCPR